MLYFEIRICLQCPHPVNQLPGCWFFLNTPEVPHLIECPDCMVHQIPANVRKMHLDNLSHHIRFRKGNMMEITASQKRIREVFFCIGCDNNDGPAIGTDGFVDLNDIEFHLIQNIQHIVLKIRVCLVDFVNQQNNPFVRHKGLAYFAHFDILFNVTHIPF